MRLDPHAKLLRHPDRIGEWLTMKRTRPILLEIAPTGYCNANCPECFFKDKHGSQRIDSVVMHRVIGELAQAGVKAINWTGGGESTLHPHFGAFVATAHRLGIEQGLFTNALREVPEQEKLAWIRITLTDRGYAAIKRPAVPFGIVVNQNSRQTPDELRELCQRAREIGAAYFQIRPALVGSWERQPRLEQPVYLQEFQMPDFQVYTTAYKYEEAIRRRDYDVCYGYHFCASIDWRGLLGVCLYMMHDDRFVFGNLNRELFADIWARNPTRVAVIEDACQNCCKNHEINRLLFAAMNVRQAHFL